MLVDVLDSKMKKLKQGGIGVQKQRVTVDEGNLLWGSGLLDDTSANVLLDAMVWLCGLCFALQGGAELCDLKEAS